MGIGMRQYRRTVLRLAGSDSARRLADRYGSSWAGRFVAGATMREALETAASLNGKGILATLDHLGEGIRRLEEAERHRDEYVRLVKGIAGRSLTSGVSLKPTQMGLGLDFETCYGHVRDIVRAAREKHIFVCLDMESSACVEPTLALIRRLRTEGLTNAGTVLQAYLRRSADDAAALIAEGVRLRLVKGAYKESSAIAYQGGGRIADSLRELIRSHLDAGADVAIGTHDERIVEWVRDYAVREGIDKRAFEFQMLYGLRTKEQERLAKEGYRVRCYVPYGVDWYPYFTRRIAEKPSHLWLVARHGWR